nr:immunoglobulin heavy chain junction region [Mus musculus]MBK4185353.1 immunoglobulin heavy chain junction region [Mus musculus]
CARSPYYYGSSYYFDYW